MSVPKVTKALIPMAGRGHATVPLQTLTGVDGKTITVIEHQVAELLAAGIQEICLVVSEVARALVAPVLARFAGQISYVGQKDPKGFGHALWCAREWTGGQPVVVQVCDHVFLSSTSNSCVQQMTEEWNLRGASICAIQRLRESEVPRVGVVSGTRLEGDSRSFLLQAFLEKPSVTKAELLPHVSGLSSSQYLCSAGIFILSPAFFDILDEFRDSENGSLQWLAPALTELMKRESFYGLEFQGRRINLEEPLGLVRAQIAMGLNSPDRGRLLALMLEESVRLNQAKKD